MSNWTRRQFLATAGALPAGLAAAAEPTYFGVHPFVEANPKAVFIRRTKVSHKMAADEKRAEGLKLAPRTAGPDGHARDPDLAQSGAQAELH